MKIKKNSIRSLDPNIERETEQYENPLPSREYILKLLKDQGVPVEQQDLFNRLNIDPHEEELFNRRLTAMERDGQIMRNRKGAICVTDKIDLIKGKVQGHPDGFGFLTPEDGSSDLVISEKEMSKCLHGDTVMARVRGMDKKGRREANIVEVLECGTTRLVGRLYEEQGIQFVVAENRRISQDILVAPSERSNAKVGQVVMVEIIMQPSKNAQPIGRVIEVLGNYADPGMEIEIALRKHDLPNKFPAPALRQAKKFSSTVSPEDYVGRESIAKLPLVTIDGETARDFDDAVYCEPAKSGFRLVVAIADVSAYVKPGDALDKEAWNRGNSVYFPRRVIPMLPEELSNGLCSINPNVERLCMVCDMQINRDGDIEEYRFYPSVMFSHARLTYTEVADMLENPQGKIAKQYAEVLPHIQNLHFLFKILLQAREKRGAIDFETIETQMIFNENGKIDKIIPIKRNDAHKLIEECMLAANVCAAGFLRDNKHPALYRVHEGPTPEKLESVREFFKEFGLQLGGGDIPEAGDYAKLLKQIKDRPDAPLLQTVMLRSLRQARYDPENVGHFGLGYEAYAHFTSPIRRYPDLLVHRAIKAVLNNKKYKPKETWEDLGIQCSLTERRADDATRDVEAWLKCFYMKDHIGSVFAGTVSSVVGFGLFVTLDDIYTEGLVHVSELGSDYFHFDPVKHQMLGERTGKRYRLGDRVQVKVVRVDMEGTKIDFALEEPIRNELSTPDTIVIDPKKLGAWGMPAPKLIPVKKPMPASKPVTRGKSKPKTATRPTKSTKTAKSTPKAKKK